MNNKAHLKAVSASLSELLKLLNTAKLKTWLEIKNTKRSNTQRQEQTRYQSCLTLPFSRAIWNKWSTSLLWCLKLEASACGNSEETDTSDHLMAESGPCASAEPGGSQELGTRTSHTCFLLRRLQLRPTSHYAKMRIIQIAVYAAFGTGTTDYGSLL